MKPQGTGQDLLGDISRMGRRGATWRRRDLLGVSGLALLTIGASGCDLLSTQPTGKEGDQGGERSNNGQNLAVKESPTLTAQVRAGKLPPLTSRLPKNPAVVTPTEQIGRYGGAWKTALKLANKGYISTFMAGYEPLVRWSSGWPDKPKTVEPNIAERFEANGDGTQFTFHLREGMRWSDGEPFTADDIVFAVNDILLNKEIMPVAPALVTAPDGRLASVQKLDDYALRISFPSPSGLFLSLAATAAGNALVNYPLHYLREFHKRYNPDVDALAKRAGFQSWTEFFQGKADYSAGGVDLPAIWAWRVTVPVGEGTQVVLERNPYYWKTDPDGRQLPYLDRITCEIIENEEVLLLKASAGELNLEAGPDTRFTTSRNKPVLARNREKGNYRFVDATNTRMNTMVIMLNLAHQDPVKREVFNNKEFRIGLSHAINRPEIISAVLQRQGEAYQVAPLPDSGFYDKEFATQYTEYDEREANTALDRAGYSSRDARGIRLGPDGKPISFTVEYVPQFFPIWTDMLDFIRGYWRKVGIDLRLRTEDQSLWAEHIAANVHDAGVWHGDGGLDVMMQPRFYFPSDGQSAFATPWATWFLSGGASGEEPPDGPKRQMQLYNQIRSTLDPEEQATLMKEILGIAKQGFYTIGVARETQKYFIASNDFHNIPNPMIQSPSIYPTVGVMHPEQFYLANP